MVSKQSPNRRIPEFSSREEEAAWWDSHLITDYLDEMEPVTVQFADPVSIPLLVRLAPAEHEELAQLAREQGVGASDLVRIWITDRLRTEGHKRPA